MRKRRRSGSPERVEIRETALGKRARRASDSAVSPVNAQSKPKSSIRWGRQQRNGYPSPDHQVRVTRRSSRRSAQLSDVNGEHHVAVPAAAAVAGVSSSRAVRRCRRFGALPAEPNDCGASRTSMEDDDVDDDDDDDDDASGDGEVEVAAASPAAVQADAAREVRVSVTTAKPQAEWWSVGSGMSHRPKRRAAVNRDAYAARDAFLGTFPGKPTQLSPGRSDSVGSSGAGVAAGWKKTWR